MTKNLTVGNPALRILFFTIPLLIGNLFQQFYSMADTFIVGNTIGVEALAAVGCTGSLGFLILGFIFGFTSGATLITSQRFGAGDNEGVGRSFACCIVLSTLMAVVLTVISVIVARPLLVLMQTPAEILEDACLYVVIIFGGAIITTLYNLLASVMRAVGDSRTPLVFLVIACVINIILDYVFILGLGMGVEGAAIATLIAQLISGILCVPVILKKLPMLRLNRASFRLSKKELAEHIKLALPMGFQMSIIAIGVVVLQFALNRLGTQAVAAFTAAQKIDMVVHMPLNSFGATMATYTAQNYGARKLERIKQGVLQCGLMSGGFSIVMGVVFVLFGRFFASLFIGANAEAVEMAHTYLTINSACYLLLALLLIFRMTIQGLGDGLAPTVAGVLELVMRAFAAIILTEFFGFPGLCFASPLAWLGAVITVGIAFALDMKKVRREMLAGKS
jgi:putative MATE family efflux protein